MGKSKKAKGKTLHQQAYEKMVAMQAFGESKMEARKNGTEKGKIFSYSTYNTYWKHIKYFIKWINKNYPECKALKKAKKHINEWLAVRVEEGRSAWTIHLELAALCKLYGIAFDDPNRFAAPKRYRADIKRSRLEVEHDKRISVEKYGELINFVRATGTRRNVLERLRGEDLWTSEQIRELVSDLENKEVQDELEKKYHIAAKEALDVFPEHRFFVMHRKDKGGKYRLAPIITDNAKQVVERMNKTEPNALVWPEVHPKVDIHSYRAEYATTMYNLYARNIDDIPYDQVKAGSGTKYQSDVYVCRKDAKGKRLDKRAMYKCSKALGHNRLDVVANYYIRGI